MRGVQMSKKSVPFILLSYVLAFSIQSFAFGAAGDAETKLTRL